MIRPAALTIRTALTIAAIASWVLVAVMAWQA